MNNFEHEQQRVTPSPYELLYDVITTHANSVVPKAHDYCDDLATYTGLDPNEVTQELLTIWLPVFKFKSALTTALDSMRISHPDDIESDFCAYYLEVLEGIKK
jgi:hypothetical protein